MFEQKGRLLNLIDTDIGLKLDRNRRHYLLITDKII